MGCPAGDFGTMCVYVWIDELPCQQYREDQIHILFVAIMDDCLVTVAYRVRESMSFV